MGFEDDEECITLDLPGAVLKEGKSLIGTVSDLEVDDLVCSPPPSVVISQTEFDSWTQV